MKKKFGKIVLICICSSLMLFTSCSKEDLSDPELKESFTEVGEDIKDLAGKVTKKVKKGASEAVDKISDTLDSNDAINDITGKIEKGAKKTAKEAKKAVNKLRSELKD